MLLKGFFNTDPFNPKTIPLTLIYTKTNAGSFSFSVPDTYNYIQIEIAGSAGQQADLYDGSNHWHGVPGKGAIKTQQFILTSNSVSGVIGAQPSKSYNQSQHGGSGYQNGNNGGVVAGGNFGILGGGGGGSSSVVCNGITITVGGGSGVGYGISSYYNAVGGAGGGPNGGPTATGTPTGDSGTVFNGNNATDTGVSGYNSGAGYVKIWGGYNPYYN